MNVSTPGDVTFASSLSLVLSDASHDVNVTEGTTVTVSSNIVGAGGESGINMMGAGTLILNGNNSFNGNFTVNGGTILLGSDSITDGGLLWGPVGLGTLRLNNGSTVTMNEESGRSLYNDIALDSGGGTVYFDVPDYSDLEVNGYIFGSASINKSGSGTITLSNEFSDFSGGFSLHEGTLMLAASSGAEGSTVTNGPVGTGGLKLYDGTRLGVNSGSPINLDNAIELDCRPSASVEVWTNSGSTLNLSGVISGAAELNKTGSGTLNLYNDNTFTGDFYVSGGMVNVHTDTGTGLGALEFGTLPGMVNFLTSAPTVHGLSSDSPYQSVSLANGSTFHINQDDTEESYNFQGTIGTTTAAVVKNGAGTQVFSGANNYSGGTTINAGVLVANHGNGSNVVDALGSGAVTLNGGTLKIGEGLAFSNTLNIGSGGTLGGTGTFTSPLTLGSGVILSPGNSPGTMTFAAGLAANNGLSTDIEINAAANNPGVNSDLIVTQGPGLNLSSLGTGQYTLRIISLSLLNGDTAGAVDDLVGGGSWTIFQNSALTGFNANLFTIDGSDFQHNGAFSLGLSGNDIVLTFTPVPEPSTYALMALGLGATGLAAWRKRRKA